MKRYQKWLLIPAIIIIAISILSGFSNPDAEKEAKKLLHMRTDLLQKAFYQQISLEEVEKKLSEIESYPLLTEDIHSLREWDASQLDLVKQMNIVSFKQEKNFMNYLTYKADIYWDMISLDENYTMKGRYYIVLKKENDQFKLSAFDPINK